MKYLASIICPIGMLLLLPNVYAATATKLPEAFFSETPDSTFKIRYDDWDALLKGSVLNVSMPSRKKVAATGPGINTRLKNRVNQLTGHNANRFYFEHFRANPQLKMHVSQIRSSIEQLPDLIDLGEFSANEQLAYWLNLYNVTVLDELLKVYPTKDIRQLLMGDDGLLERKILKVAGVKLSLNDIDREILQTRFVDEPLYIYGLYQGHIGSPNIRKHAYTGDNVKRALQHNAVDFVNSNRGTYPVADRFHISVFYQQYAALFPDFNADLKVHLSRYLDPQEQDVLATAPALLADIENWQVTDVYGSNRQFGGGAASNAAALLDGFSPSNNGEISNTAMLESLTTDKVVPVSIYSPEQIKQLKELNLRRLQQSGTVTVTDLLPQATEVKSN